jgi:hypothetical protein
VQPVQLSLIPDQVPPPPAALIAQLPDPDVAAAVGLLAELIAKTAALPAGTGRAEASDE